MELKDAIFDNMSFEDWTTSVESKVHSFYNLHLLFLQDITHLPASPAPHVRPTKQPATPTRMP